MAEQGTGSTTGGGVRDGGGGIVQIEIAFPTPVAITEDDMRMLDSIAGEICERYERAHPGRVMWPAGHGQKITKSLFRVGDDEPIPFDPSVYAIDCAEREDYDWPCAKCGITQGEHEGLILEPKAGACKFEPAPPKEQPRRPRGLVPMHVYLAAVNGRREMRQALKEVRAEIATLRARCEDASSFAWLIEAPGPAYMAAIGVTAGARSERQSVSQFFRWTDDHAKALRFARQEDAERAMFAIRGLAPDLFPAVFPTFPKAVEHGWHGEVTPAPDTGHAEGERK